MCGVHSLLAVASQPLLTRLPSASLPIHICCRSAIAGRWEMVGSKLARVVYALDTAKVGLGYSRSQRLSGVGPRCGFWQPTAVGRHPGHRSMYSRTEPSAGVSALPCQAVSYLHSRKVAHLDLKSGCAYASCTFSSCCCCSTLLLLTFLCACSVA